MAHAKKMSILHSTSFTTPQAYLINRALSMMSMWHWTTFNADSHQHCIVQEWIAIDLKTREKCDAALNKLVQVLPTCTLPLTFTTTTTTTTTDATAATNDIDLDVPDNHQFLLHCQPSHHTITLTHRTTMSTTGDSDSTNINIRKLIKILNEYRLTTPGSTTELDICTLLNI